MPAARRCRAFLVLLATLVAASVRAEGVVDQLPADSLGFAVVRDLAGANAKIEKLMKIFEGIAESAPPAPLVFIKAATGIGDGLNEQGEAAIALLPGASGAADPRPLFLVPVSDYGKFAESISGDASGEICRVAIAGEEVLVAKRGDYAMLMNVEHRPMMESLLAAAPKANDALQPLAQWLAANDAAVVLTRAGVEALTALGRESVDQQQAEMEEQLGDPEFAEMLEANKNGLEFAELLLGFGLTEVQAAGVGVSIDEATNLRLSKRVSFVPGGEVAKLDDIQPLDHSPFAGFADEPFLAAIGGPVPAQWRERMSGVFRRIMEKFPNEYGFENLDEAQWKKVEESWQGNMKGVRSTSSIMHVGEKTDPIFTNIYSVTKVENSQEYLKSNRSSFEIWNELLSESTSDLADKMKYELEDGEVAGKPALKMTVDVVAAAADDNVPMIAPMMKSMFGGDGKFSMQIVAADPTTVVAGAAAEERLTKVLDQAVAGDTGLADSAAVQTCVKLLEPNAPWQALVSPQGCVAWAKRFVDQVFGQLGGAINVPDFPDSPPVGFSASLAADQFHVEMVWPVDTLESLADYIKTCMKAE